MARKSDSGDTRVEYIGDREAKQQALNSAVSSIEKNFGKGSIMKLGDSVANMNTVRSPAVRPQWPCT